MKRFLPLLVALLPLAADAFAGDAAEPTSEPTLDPPTLHCLGAYWPGRGDDNRNAAVTVEWRKADGGNDWKHGPPLFRVEKGRGGGGADLPPDAWLFAGSVFDLEPGTAYELRLTLSDPDGGRAEKILAATTIAEPAAPGDARVFHVVPGDGGGGGGTGTEADPFKGLAAARRVAVPNTIFLLHPGVYQGTFLPVKNGSPGKPVVWRGVPGGGEVVLEGRGEADKRPAVVIDAVGLHDVWFENLTIRNAAYAISANDAARIVVRRCRMTGVDNGLVATRNRNNVVAGFFVSDNVVEGPSTWPRSKGIESARGVQLTGSGHVVCYNRISGFADAINTAPSAECSAIDFHNNDVSELTDDGIEMDGSRRNTRCFRNRLTNVFQGVSFQPVHGGPVYAFRNAMYNVAAAPFKLHSGPSGVLMVHNTVAKAGAPNQLTTPEEVRNCVSRNNLFVGTAGHSHYVFENGAAMVDCDFDRDGFGCGGYDLFLKWNGVRYERLEDVKANAPVYRRAVWVDATTTFASGAQPPRESSEQFEPARNDLRLKAGGAAVDAGEAMAGFNDGYRGEAPDLGAYESGDDPPHYGPRPRDRGD